MRFWTALMLLTILVCQTFPNSKFWLRYEHFFQFAALYNYYSPTWHFGHLNSHFGHLTKHFIIKTLYFSVFEQISVRPNILICQTSANSKYWLSYKIFWLTNKLTSELQMCLPKFFQATKWIQVPSRAMWWLRRRHRRLLNDECVMTRCRYASWSKFTLLLY